MDGAKHNTDTLAALIESSSKQACLLRRRFSERKVGAVSNENPGKSKK